MAKPNQVRGALLEEVILWFLEFAGYKTVTAPGADPTLRSGPAGLEVRGRGTTHQIDAVADFTIGQPFSNPQRLLVEAKAYDQDHKIGIRDVRNAVGVLKDVAEFWGGTSSPRRYHYQYAVFSLTPFTPIAQRYAFAQDIYLVPLARSLYFSPIATALRSTVDQLPKRADGQVDIASRDLRTWLRAKLRGEPPGLDRPDLETTLQPLTESIERVGRGLLGVAGRAFPLFLVPREPSVVEGLGGVLWVRITRQQETCVLRPLGDGEPLFSFDIPGELARLYEEEGVLSRERALDLKAEHLSEIQALYNWHGETRLVTFRLDQDWLRAIRDRRAAR